MKYFKNIVNILVLMILPNLLSMILFIMYDRYQSEWVSLLQGVILAAIIIVVIEFLSFLSKNKKQLLICACVGLFINFIINLVFRYYIYMMPGLLNVGYMFETISIFSIMSGIFIIVLYCMIRIMVKDRVNKD